MEFRLTDEFYPKQMPNYSDGPRSFHEYGVKFTVPWTNDVELPFDAEDKVCVVSVIGKSSLAGSKLKFAALNSVIGDEVFKEASSITPDKTSIQAYHDKRANVIYLHLDSYQDSSLLVRHCAKTDCETGEKLDFHTLWQDLDHEFTKCLLFIFSVSHIVLINLPHGSFEVSYVRLFRIVDQIRIKLQPSVSDILKTLSISKDWVLAGRPCAPRVLFNVNYRASDQSHKSKKSLQHCIEDQVYRVLRKSRVITNISNNSLFAIPANQEFVYVGNHDDHIQDSVSFLLEQLRSGCTNTREPVGPLHSYQTMRRNNQTGSGTPFSPDTTSSSKTPGETASIADFLGRHVDLAHGKGFDDNVGRTHVQAVFELPSAATWYRVCERMFQFFMHEPVDGSAKSGFTTLRSLLDIDTRFSESRCHKVLPVAENAYQEGLPPFYTRAYHEDKLLAARRVFVQHARGPACDKYLHELDKLCTRLWEIGRRQCEAVSLTGLPCLNELHHSSEFVEPNSPVLPVLPHCSQIKSKSTCNCGRKQADRDDPFTHEEANFLFYQRLSENCCSKLETIELPVFKPSTDNAKAGTVDGSVQTPVSTLHQDHSNKPHQTRSPQVRKESFGPRQQDGMSNLSLAMSLGQSGSSQVFSADHSTAEQTTEPRPPLDESQSQGEEEDSDSEKEEEAPPTPMSSALKTVTTERQHSTVEYLSGMIHSQCGQRLLPKFSSWAISVLGRYTSYSHAQGLDQPGFLHGSNFLIPWDITLRVDRERWPSVTESKRNKGKKGHRDGGELSLKVFIGLEYECPRGHRFFMSAPDRMIRANSGGGVKDGPNKLLTSDMPLYSPCQCRANKGGYMAQLMRIFVAAPEGPMHVTLTPRVRPAPEPCPVFFPGNDKPINLPPGMVSVLRLPYVYLGDSEPYYMPDEHQQLLECRLFKGVFGYTENEGAAK